MNQLGKLETSSRTLSSLDGRLFDNIHALAKDNSINGLRIIGSVLLHATKNHGLGRHSLPDRRIGEGLELLVVPVLGRDIAALAVHEHGVVLGAQEVSNRIAVFGGVERHDAVDARLELHAAGKTE